MAPSPYASFVLLVLFIVNIPISGFPENGLLQQTTHQRENVKLLNSDEEKIYQGLPLDARSNWMKTVYEKKLKQQLEEMNTELEKERKARRIAEKAWRIAETNKLFNGFMCAINLIRQILEGFIFVTTGRTWNDLPVDDTLSMKWKCSWVGKRALKVIQRILPENQAEQDGAFEIFVRFFYVIKYCDSAVLKKLNTALVEEGILPWECAAVAAAIRKLGNRYMHRDGSPAVKIFMAYSSINAAASFPEIIRQYNHWYVTPRDLYIINVLSSNLPDGYVMSIETFTNKDGTELAIPSHDPASPTCLSQKKKLGNK